MGSVRWLTKNWANTHEPTHPDLGPLTLPGSLVEAVRRVEQVVGNLPRWQTNSADPITGTIHLTHRTRLWRFVDDVRLTLAPGAGGTVIHAESRSRVGVGDLGQNRRNILELWSALS
jgi:uncharacterized protein (DUF1499 family)